MKYAIAKQRRRLVTLMTCAMLLSLGTPLRSNAEEPAPWRASWIAAQTDASVDAKASRPLPLFRYEFPLNKRVDRATLQISGLGQFEAHVNGRNVTGAVLTPGWTDYRKRIFYDTYDVTNLLQQGGNAIGVMLGNGMYNVQPTKDRYIKFSGSFGQPKLILQMEVRFADGSRQTIVSDAAWKTAPGPILFSSIYGGEDYDARREQPGWDQPGFHDQAWAAAAIVAGPGGKLTAENMPPIEPLDRYDPVTITHPSAAIAVYDLGQNFSGWPEIVVTGKPGTRVTMTPGELLDEHGLVTQKSAHAFPDAAVLFTYVLKGEGQEQWHPRFSYYGFRYVQVEQQGKRLLSFNNSMAAFFTMRCRWMVPSARQTSCSTVSIR